MSLRDIEEGGLRFYEAKGRANGECDDATEPDDDYDPGFCDGCDCPLTPDVECGLCAMCCGTDDG